MDLIGLRERARRLAESQAERGLFVRDDFGKPNTHALNEWVAFAADAAGTRHYVCEAHVPLGEPGNHDDICPCCEAVRLAEREARLREALAPVLAIPDDDEPDMVALRDEVRTLAEPSG